MRRIRTYVDVMSADEVERIHRNSLRILSEIGLRVPNAEVLAMCRERGGEVDFDQEIVKIPVRVMKDLIARIQAHSRVDYDAMERASLCAGVSTQVFFYDYQTKTRRYGLMDDVKKGICLLEQLEHFPGSGAVTLPSDVPHDFADVASFFTVYSYAKKGRRHVHPVRRQRQIHR